jgi:hypothetical protein
MRCTEKLSVVVTSCGRHDLLSRTLRSFFAFNTFPIFELIIVEDGHTEPTGLCLPAFARVVKTGNRIGQARAIDFAYRMVRSPWIFHLEDDWEFYEKSFIEKSLLVMGHNEKIVQVWLRALNDTNGHPIELENYVAAGVPYKLLKIGHGVWHGFSWNPGLRRTDDYQRLGSFERFYEGARLLSVHIEHKAAEFYKDLGFRAAILADNNGNGYLRHIGADRHVDECLNF